jgi:hypothetical protein
MGVNTGWKVNTYYHAIQGVTTDAGDDKIQGLVEWIKKNTNEKDVFVSEQYLSKIIMGLGERRVLANGDPGYMFMQGEGERAVAADMLLYSNGEVYTPSVRVRDQYPVENENPIIALLQNGYYSDILYFADGFWQVTAETGGNQFIVSPYHITQSNSSSPLSVTYQTPDIIFQRDVKIEDDGIRITFLATPTNPDVTLSSMKVNAWRPWDNYNLTDIKFDGASFSLIDGQINAKVVVTDPSQTDQYLSDTVYKQAGFECTFLPQNGSIKGEFYIPYPTSNQSGVQALTAKTAVQQYDVSYFAILNSDKDQIQFLDTNGDKKVYTNSLVTVFQVK